MIQSPQKCERKYRTGSYNFIALFGHDYSHTGSFLLFFLFHKVHIMIRLVDQCFHIQFV